MNVSIDSIRPRDLLLLAVLALLAFGVVMVESAAQRVPHDVQFGLTSQGLRQMCFAIAGVVFYVIASRIDPTRLLSGASWRSAPAAWGMAIAIVLCGVVLVPSLGTAVKGAHRWIEFGPLRIQPSEVGKWAAVAYLAWMLSVVSEQRTSDDKQRTFFQFIKLCLPIGLLCGLVAIEDLGTGVLIASAALVILIAGRTKWWHLAVTVPPALAAVVGFVMAEPYRLTRLTSFLNPLADPGGSGYHMVQSLLSFADGGIFGAGLGNGVQKLGYLPEDTTDFIFSVIAEELGLFGAMFVVLLYLILLGVAMGHLKRSRSGLSRLLVLGTIATLTLQATINIAVATVSVPPKGISLPLISAGGSGILITCFMLGLCHAMIARDEQPTEAGDPVAPNMPTPEPA